MKMRARELLIPFLFWRNANIFEHQIFAGRARKYLRYNYPVYFTRVSVRLINNFVFLAACIFDNNKHGALTRDGSANDVRGDFTIATLIKLIIIKYDLKIALKHDTHDMHERMENGGK